MLTDIKPARATHFAFQFDGTPESIDALNDELQASPGRARYIGPDVWRFTNDTERWPLDRVGDRGPGEVLVFARDPLTGEARMVCRYPSLADYTTKWVKA
jgi:hypothetical protein